MKLKYSILMLSLMACATVQVQASQESVFCSNESSCKDKNNNCKCYCSDVCGPRDKKPDDTLIWEEQLQRCWCKQRDIDNYHPHQCHIMDENKGK